MRIAIINSNSISIKSDAKKGTEIFSYIFTKNLANRIRNEHLDIQVTSFASGDSDLLVKTESINYFSSLNDKSIPDEKHIIFELALISEAFSRQNEFDLFHINIGDGDIVLPFIKFIKKPVIITLHNTNGEAYVKKYFSLFNKLQNVQYVSISDFQRKYFPDLNYAGTIYHGIDVNNNFTYDEKGGEAIMWAGRGIPKKGLDVAIKIARKVNKKAKIFPLIKKEHHIWLEHQMNDLKANPPRATITFQPDTPRLSLIPEYQQSKLFLFPIEWEEPFGFVVIESMACGTPVIAYARGSMSEIIKDGETGFLIDPYSHDVRGKRVIKKTGIAGLREAVRRIYAMSDDEYLKMREACRKHAKKYFTVERMVDEYIIIYKQAIKEYNENNSL